MFPYVWHLPVVAEFPIGDILSVNRMGIFPALCALHPWLCFLSSSTIALSALFSSWELGVQAWASHASLAASPPSFCISHCWIVLFLHNSLSLAVFISYRDHLKCFVLSFWILNLFRAVVPNFVSGAPLAKRSLCSIAQAIPKITGPDETSLVCSGQVIINNCSLSGVVQPFCLLSCDSFIFI